MNETQYINSISPVVLPELDGSTNWHPQQMCPYLLNMFCMMSNVPRPVFDMHFVPRTHTSGRTETRSRVSDGHGCVV